MKTIGIYSIYIFKDINIYMLIAVCLAVFIQSLIQVCPPVYTYISIHTLQSDSIIVNNKC